MKLILISIKKAPLISTLIIKAIFLFPILQVPLANQLIQNYEKSSLKYEYFFSVLHF